MNPLPRIALGARRRVAAGSLVALVLLAGQPAQARNDVRLLSIAEALQTPRNRELVGNLALRFGKETAKGVEIAAANVTVEGEGNAWRDDGARVDAPAPSDDQICRRAFDDALSRLVIAARRVSAISIVGIVSVYKNEVLDDPRHFECHAGLLHSWVSLRGQLSRSVLHSRAVPPPTGFADLNDVKALPASDAARERYAHFLTLPKPRAFVLLEDGNWRFYAQDPEAMTKALDWCLHEGKRCWLYAVDDRVVWSNDLDKRISLSAQLAPEGAPAPADQDEHQ